MFNVNNSDKPYGLGALSDAKRNEQIEFVAESKEVVDRYREALKRDLKKRNELDNKALQY